MLPLSGLRVVPCESWDVNTCRYVGLCGDFTRDSEPSTLIGGDPCVITSDRLKTPENNNATIRRPFDKGGKSVDDIARGHMCPNPELMDSA